MLYALRHALKSEDFDFLSNLIIRLQKKSVWKHGGGQSHNPPHCLGPPRSSTISVALALITTWEDDVTGSSGPPGR